MSAWAEKREEEEEEEGKKIGEPEIEARTSKWYLPVGVVVGIGTIAVVAGAVMVALEVSNKSESAFT